MGDAPVERTFPPPLAGGARGEVAAAHASAGPRLIFANQLRGLAAMCVAGSHLVGVFWAMRDFVSLSTATPAQVGPNPPIFGLFAHTYLNFGPLGVGVFFLISGLVIPISLAQHTRGSFLLARILRIYPTYVAALLVEMAVLHADAAYWHRPFPFGDWTIVSNALLIYNTVGQPSVDLVNWTLCVELKFYLLMMLLAPQIRRASLAALMLPAALLLAGILAVQWPPIAASITRHDLVETFTTEAVFLIYMLIGVLFNFRLRGRLGLAGLAAAGAALLAMFLVGWTHSSIATQFPVVTVNYLYDIALFGVLFALRRYARPFRVLDFMARISFPFYLIHSAIGYAVLRLLMLRCGFGYFPALAVALGTVIGAAYLLHVSIELRTIAWGKALARRARRVGQTVIRLSAT
jgi:peptidoglycan/LPS O-acetylase OafA/YrhL